VRRGRERGRGGERGRVREGGEKSMAVVQGLAPDGKLLLIPSLKYCCRSV